MLLILGKNADAISKIVWDNYITMSPSDCYKLFGIDNSNSKSAWDGIHLGQEEKLCGHC